MSKKIQPLKGFRDFLPKDAIKRQKVLDTIRNIFENFGYDPLETPSLEYQELLLNKYGEEANKLIYAFEDLGGRKVALKYDQTVPTSRIISTYKEEVAMPWKRYQIQNVWRAENPQKGRFREFLQCDIDIFGTKSIVSDAEIINTAWKVLEKLGFKNIKVLINDREILYDIMKKNKISNDLQSSVIQSIDKLDKKSESEIKKELISKKILASQVNKLFKSIKEAKPSSKLSDLFALLESFGILEKDIEFTPFLSRGLDYYTGTIFEIKIPNYEAGSIAGGGRYDNLIEKLSGTNIPAVGISFGFDRLIDALEENKLLKEEITSTKVLVTIFSEKHLTNSIQIVNLLRNSGISSEIYPDTKDKLQKQLKYADKKGILWVVIIGPEEIIKGNVTLKNLKSKTQETIPSQALLTKIT